MTIKRCCLFVAAAAVAGCAALDEPGAPTPGVQLVWADHDGNPEDAIAVSHFAEDGISALEDEPIDEEGRPWCSVSLLGCYSNGDALCSISVSCVPDRFMWAVSACMVLANEYCWIP